MALGPMQFDDSDVKLVTFGNTSAVSIPTSGANITVTQSGSDDLTGYTLVGTVQWALLGSGTDKLTIRGYSVSGSTKQLYVNNLGSSTVSLAAGYATITLAYVKL